MLEDPLLCSPVALSMQAPVSDLRFPSNRAQDVPTYYMLFIGCGRGDHRSKWQSWHLNPDLSSSRAHALTLYSIHGFASLLLSLLELFFRSFVSAVLCYMGLKRGNTIIWPFYNLIPGFSYFLPVFFSHTSF